MTRFRDFLRPGGPALRQTLLAAHRLFAAPDPDVETLAHAAREIAACPQRADNFLRELMLTPESAALNVPRLVTASRRVASPPPVVALGTHCFTSSFLERWQLKPWSGPFDWLFSSVPMVAHGIADDFQLLLDPGQYRPVPVEARRDGPTVNRVDHAYYHAECGVQYVFNHHDVHMPDDHAYLVRCVARLRGLLADTGPKVFVVTTRHAPGAVEAIERLADVLRQRTTRFKLIVCLVEPEAAPWPTLEPLRLEPDLEAHVFRSMSAWGPTAFADLLDEHMMARLVFRAIDEGLLPERGN